MMCSPLLHLRRRGCHEMERYIRHQSFLGRSNMSIVEKNKMQENTNTNERSTTAEYLQTLNTYFCNRAHTVHNAKRKTFTHINKGKKWMCLLKNTLYSWVFGLPRSSVVKLMSVVVVWAVWLRTRTSCCCWLTDWSTGWQAAAESELSCTQLKPRDRNPTAFCMWHGRLECV